MSTKDEEDFLRVPTEADRDRLNTVWREIAADPNVSFSPANRMEIWTVEHRVRSERLASARLTRATWVLSVATVVLAFATVALLVVTIHGGYN